MTAKKGLPGASQATADRTRGKPAPKPRSKGEVKGQMSLFDK